MYALQKPCYVAVRYILKVWKRFWLMKKMWFILLVALCLLLPFGALATHVDHTSPYCLACDVEAKIQALPDTENITLQNAAQVLDQIHAIDRIKFDLTDQAYEAVIKDDVQRYHEAVAKIETLTGVRLTIDKSFSIPGISEDELDLSSAIVHMKLERQDGSAWEPVGTFTLQSLYSSAPNTLGLDAPTWYSGSALTAAPFGYTADDDGWAYSYPLLPGTYRVTEVEQDKPITINGQSVYTAPVQNGIVVEVGDGQNNQVTILNGLPQIYVQANQTVLKAGDEVTLTAVGENDNDVGTGKWQYRESVDENWQDVENGISKNPCTFTVTEEMDGREYRYYVEHYTDELLNTVTLSVQPADPASPGEPFVPSATTYTPPKTGDSAPLAALFVLAALSVGGLLMLKRRSA